MLPWLADQTVTRLRATSSTDGYGDASANWTSPSSLDIAGCSVQPMIGEEILANRDAIVSRWQWFGPYDADVTGRDRIRFDSVVYEIDGSVQKWRDPTGSGLDHLTAILRAANG